MVPLFAAACGVFIFCCIILCIRSAFGLAATAGLTGAAGETGVTGVPGSLCWFSIPSGPAAERGRLGLAGGRGFCC